MHTLMAKRKFSVASRVKLLCVGCNLVEDDEANPSRGVDLLHDGF
jgi:hypothetical protein